MTRPGSLIERLKQAVWRLFDPLLAPFRITQQVVAEEEAKHGDDVRNLTILHHAERIFIADPKTDPFVRVGKYYRDGFADRNAIYVCEIPDAYLHLPSGLVCTRHFKAVLDRGFEERTRVFSGFNQRKPSGVKKLPGTYSTINYCLAGNSWHWMLDCMPKIHSLAQVAAGAEVKLLLPPSLREFQRESLASIVPENFEIIYQDRDEWVQTERFLWPSLVDGRCLGLIPQDYYASIREPVFSRFGLTAPHVRKERIYISRQRATHRRVLNEDAVMACLQRYGFRCVYLEDLSFCEEVELFHQADIVIGAHGAGFASIFFSGPIDIVVLYPTRVPPNYFHTMAVGLGQRHHFLCHDGEDEDDHLEVNIAELEELMAKRLKLTAR